MVETAESVPLVLMLGGGVTLKVQSVVAAGAVASQLDAVLPMAESKVAAVPEYVAVVSLYLAAAPLAGEMKVEPAVKPLGRALVTKFAKGLPSMRYKLPSCSWLEGNEYNNQTITNHKMIMSRRGVVWSD